MTRDEQMEELRGDYCLARENFLQINYDDYCAGWYDALKAADESRQYTDEDVRSLAEAVKDAHYAKRPEERALALGSAMDIAERILKREA